jgi:hypothetical protein
MKMTLLSLKELIELLNAGGVSLRALARSCGKDHSNLSKAKRGSRFGRVTAQAVAEATHTTAVLVNGTFKFSGNPEVR